MSHSWEIQIFKKIKLIEIGMKKPKSLIAYIGSL